jgi:hypothetical protein
MLTKLSFPILSTLVVTFSFIYLTASRRAIRYPIGSDSDFFANMCVDAMLQVKSVNQRGEVKYPVKAASTHMFAKKSESEPMILLDMEVFAMLTKLSFPILPQLF